MSDRRPAATSRPTHAQPDPVTRRLAPAVVIVVALAVAAASLLLTAGRAAVPQVVRPEADQLLVCPAAPDQAGLLSAMTTGTRLTSGAVATRPSAGPNPIAGRAVTGAVAVGASGPALGGVLAAPATSRLSWAACGQPVTQGLLQLADPAASEIVLVNPDADEISVDLTLYGATGDVTSAGSRGLSVPAHAVRIVPISVLAKPGSALGVAFSTDAGRVAAAVRDQSAGTDQTSPSAVGTELGIAGVVSGATSVSLLVTNPSDVRATVTVTAHGSGGPFVPQGANQVAVEPKSTLVLDLTTPLNHEAVGLSVSADHAVAATAVVTTRTDSATIPAVVAAAGQLLVVPQDAAMLHVTNVQQTPVEVALTINGARSTVTVPGGVTLTRPVNTGTVVLQAGGAVVASVSIGRGGALGVVEGVAVTSGAAGVWVQNDPGLR